VKISIIVEGKTETAFNESLRKFLATRVGQMPKLDFVPRGGRIPKGEQLKRLVKALLEDQKPADAVIALTDVYTGTPDFLDAQDAKQKMRAWVGDEERFHPHAAQYEFEAWLLPFWPTIQKLAGHNGKPPAGHPENVNHGNPPARRIGDLFERGTCRDSYSKARDAKRILRDNDLQVAAAACPELRLFLNTILRLCGGNEIS
jgi:hypothetical protein